MLEKRFTRDSCQACRQILPVSYKNKNSVIIYTHIEGVYIKFLKHLKKKLGNCCKANQTLPV